MQYQYNTGTYGAGGSAGAGMAGGGGAGVGAGGVYASGGAIYTGQGAGYATGGRVAAGGQAAGEAGCCGDGFATINSVNGQVNRLPAGASIQDVGGIAAGGVCGGAGGCTLGEECLPGQGMMGFVGAGGGDYVTETTYRYVGEGQGDIRFVTQSRRTYFGLALCLALLVGIIVLVATTTPQKVSALTKTQKPADSTTTQKLAASTMCQKVEDCYGCSLGADCDKCNARNNVHCCAFDDCKSESSFAARMKCQKEQGTVDKCCAGNDLAPQCGCQPVVSCDSCEGEQCTECKDTNNAHCCLEDHCHEQCPDGEEGERSVECRQCREEHHDTCCSGNALAPGCALPGKQRCIFWGDPHVVTFDNARPSFYGDGEFWIVKNPKVYIQGRYMGTRYTYGLAATNKVMIGGPFLHGHTIEVETMENNGKILVDGQEVCKERGTTHKIEDGLATLATISHNTQGRLVDEAASQFERHIVHIHLPGRMHLTVFRWTNYLDLDLRTPPLEGEVDGSCGNMNGKKSDDNTQDIFKRVGARIGHGHMLFEHRHSVDFTSEEYDMLMTCHREKRERSRDTCLRELDGTRPTENQLHSCMFDYCFGMNEHALRSARTFASNADRAAAGEMSSTA